MNSGAGGPGLGGATCALCTATRPGGPVCSGALCLRAARQWAAGAEFEGGRAGAALYAPGAEFEGGRAGAARSAPAAEFEGGRAGPGRALSLPFP